MKIALIGPFDLSSIGGVPTHIRALYQELTRLGHQVHLVVKAVSQELASAWRPLPQWSPESYDVCHVHQEFPANILASQIPRGVFTYHGCLLRKLLSLHRIKFIWRWARTPWIQKVLKDDHQGGHWARKVVCVDRASKREVIWLHGILPRKVSVIPNGHFPVAPDPERSAQVRQKLGLPEASFVFLFVGRQGDPQKNPSAAVAAFNQFLQRGHEAYLVMIPGTDKEPLGPRVISAGNQPLDQMCHYYGLADALVVTSILEGFPVVIPEAMAAGLPVLATRIGGIPDIVKHGFNGLLVPRSCQGLAESMERILSDFDLRKRLGQAARETAKDYTWERVAKETEAVYEAACTSQELS